jgi:hypothetical protein
MFFFFSVFSTLSGLVLSRKTKAPKTPKGDVSGDEGGDPSDTFDEDFPISETKKKSPAKKPKK